MHRETQLLHVYFAWNFWIVRAFCRLILSSMPGSAAATHGFFGIHDVGEHRRTALVTFG